MKKILMMALPLLTAVVLGACDEKSRLAADVEGTWTGAPERIFVSDAATSSVTRVITFTRGDKDSPSTVSIDAMFAVEMPLPATDSIVQPISVTAAGTATVEGTWQAIDDDEIAVVLDRSTLKVNVDPDAVTLSAGPLTTPESAVGALKPAVALEVQHHITKAMNESIHEFNKIDDIKIKNNIMSCEVGKKDLTFHRSSN